MRKPVQHRLFLALVPPVPVIPEIAWIRDVFPSRRIVPDHQLHMTLLPFPLSHSFPKVIAEGAMLALSGADLAGCRLIVDRLVLGRRSGLLQPSEAVSGLVSLQRKLARLLLPSALHARAENWFSPHLTLFYDGPTRPSVGIDPISWRADELVLVHSFHGEGRHETLARWPLRR